MKKNEGIMELIISDLVPVIADDLLDLQKADDIARGTEFFRVLSAECTLSDDFDLNNLILNHNPL